MAVYLGADKIAELYLGSTKIGEAYYGSTLVYRSAVTLTINPPLAVYSSYGKGGNGHYSNSVNGTAGYVKVIYKGA